MISVKTLVGSLAAPLLVLAAGCAPAYHSYSDCHVECRYCPPSPLPHTQYGDRDCHAYAAVPYLTAASTSGEQEANDGTPRD